MKNKKNISNKNIQQLEGVITKSLSIKFYFSFNKKKKKNKPWQNGNLYFYNFILLNRNNKANITQFTSIDMH